MNWIVLMAVLVIVGYVLDREIYFYEGAHLGTRLQAWLYDRWSRKYDEGKRPSQLHDGELLAEPLLEALHDISEPFILDFATGTGRMSYALSQHPQFKGRIVALDLSQGMLEQAAKKLRGCDRQVEFLRHSALPLPFPDGAFDAVCALEVLELFPAMDKPLQELTRVLRPGGVLLTSRGTEESGRTAKVKSVAEFETLLEGHGLENVQISAWWRLFDRVIAVKRGSSRPATTKSLSQVLRCGTCRSSQWAITSSQWTCQVCRKISSVTGAGILLN